MPLRSDDKLIGVLWLRAKAPDAYSTADLEIAERISDQIAGAIASSRLSSRLMDKRWQAEDALRESADKYRRLYDNTPVMMHSIDPHSRLISVNNYWLRTMGYERDEVIGRKITDFLTEPSCRFAEEVGIPTFFATGVVRENEIQMVKKNGDVIDVLLSALADRDSEGRITSSMTFVVDITERKRLEAQLLHSQKMEAIGTLAGGVAHDFNNMLTAITSYTDLSAASVGKNEPVRGYLLGVQKAAERATSLTRQLLAFSRHQMVKPRVIDPNDVVANVEKMLRRLIREDIELIVVPNSTLRRVAVDPGQMEQVLMNLVVNSSDAMPDGGRLVIEAANVTLDVADGVHLPAIPPGDYAVLRVRDTGVGMSKEVQARIFEPFFTTKEVHRGTGLGLSTAYGIVAQSGGTITVESEAGEGTEFQIYLPSVGEAADATPLWDDTVGFLPVGNETVLLVEDELMVRSAASEALRQQGYTVLEAGDGVQALEVAEAHSGQPIHLVVTDVVMPRMSGEELGARFSALHPEAKVLYASGYTEDKAIREGIATRSIYFLQKPFRPATLAQRVREILDQPDPTRYPLAAREVPETADASV